MPDQPIAMFVSSRLELLQAAALAARIERRGLGLILITAESAPELAAEARWHAGRGWARGLGSAEIEGGHSGLPGAMERLLFQRAPVQLVLPGALENPAGPVSICGIAARRNAIPAMALWPEDTAALLSDGLTDALASDDGAPKPPNDYILAEFSPYGVWGWPTARARLAELLEGIEQRHEIAVDWTWRRGLPDGVSEWARLAAGARLILTDRTDVQIAACLLGCPCVSLRERTPVPETVRAGAAVLAGARFEEVDLAVGLMARKTVRWVSPWPSVPLVLN